MTQTQETSNANPLFSFISWDRSPTGSATIRNQPIRPVTCIRTNATSSNHQSLGQSFEANLSP